MCTVTFLACRDNVFITSSRDEHIARKQAIPPLLISNENNRMLYPTDAAKGGTWIAVKDNGDIAVLLNGAFRPHLKQPIYQQSRGYVIPVILKHQNPILGFNNYDCNTTEPFTLILFSKKALYECTWDGTHKVVNKIDNSYGIWSSVTLYTSEAISKRKLWFKAWRNRYNHPTRRDILQFHLDAGDDNDKANALLMQRSNGMQTISITSVAVNEHEAKMMYYNVLKNANYIKHVSLVNTVLQSN